MTKVYLASDHAGFELKKELIPYIGTLGHEVEDVGAFTLEPEDDYPPYMKLCAEKVVEAQRDAASGSVEAQQNPAPGRILGIIMGGSGEGEAMVANRQDGVRAAEYYGGNLDIVKLAREHNDANILSLGARFVTIDEAKEAVRTFLETPFSDAPRHARRIAEF